MNAPTPDPQLAKIRAVADAARTLAALLLDGSSLISLTGELGIPWSADPIPAARALRAERDSLVLVRDSQKEAIAALQTSLDRERADAARDRELYAARIRDLERDLALHASPAEVPTASVGDPAPPAEAPPSSAAVAGAVSDPAARCAVLESDARLLRQSLEEARAEAVAANVRAEKAEHRVMEIEDIGLARRQFPDGSVPGNTVECAEGWHRWAEEFQRDRDHFKAAYSRKLDDEKKALEWAGRAVAERDALRAEVDRLRAETAARTTLDPDAPHVPHPLETRHPSDPLAPDQCPACGHGGLSLDKLNGACPAVSGHDGQGGCPDPLAWLRNQETNGSLRGSSAAGDDSAGPGEGNACTSGAPLGLQSADHGNSLPKPSQQCGAAVDQGGALEPRSAPATFPLDDYLASRGAGAGSWNTPEGREYLASLRDPPEPQSAPEVPGEVTTDLGDALRGALKEAAKIDAKAAEIERGLALVDARIEANEPTKNGRTEEQQPVADRLHPEMRALLPRAIEALQDASVAPVSFIQIKLGCGFNAANILLEELERQGIVGPFKGVGVPREVLKSAVGGGGAGSGGILTAAGEQSGVASPAGDEPASVPPGVAPPSSNAVAPGVPQNGALPSAEPTRPPVWLYRPDHSLPEGDPPTVAHSFVDGYLKPSACGVTFPAGKSVWGWKEGDAIEKCAACSATIALPPARWGHATDQKAIHLWREGLAESECQEETTDAEIVWATERPENDGDVCITCLATDAGTEWREAFAPDRGPPAAGDKRRPCERCAEAETVHLVPRHPIDGDPEWVRFWAGKVVCIRCQNDLRAGAPMLFAPVAAAKGERRAKPAEKCMVPECNNPGVKPPDQRGARFCPELHVGIELSIRREFFKTWKQANPKPPKAQPALPGVTQ